MALEFDFGAREVRDDALARFAARVAAEEPTTDVWSYTNAGWCVLGRAVETVTGGSWEEAMRAELLAPAGMRETAFATESHSEARVSGHELTPEGPIPVAPLEARTYGPAGLSMVSTVGDMLRFAALHLEEPALATLRHPQPGPRIHGWLDGWCLGWAWFDWEGGRVWGWDSVVPGERAFLRLVPERKAAAVLLTNSDRGRVLYRSLFPELMQSSFGIGVPPLRLDARPGAVGDMSRFEGVYAWPDRRAEVTATDTGLVVAADGVEAEARAIDDRTFALDASDPDTPTVTFGAFDERGRPHALYLMLWALPRA